MSKIICDVCGTAYPDTATQCPICGCVNLADVADTQTTNVKTGNSEAYTYVKGGRFSKANVQKRNQGLHYSKAVSGSSKEGDTSPAEKRSDTGLVIAVCALLLAIIVVAFYIVVHFFASADGLLPKTTNPVTTAAVETTEETTPETSTVSYACVDVVLAQTKVTLTSVGETLSLGVFLAPADTTDELQFISENIAVATVSDVGEIVAVGPGETNIIVTCGEISATCAVVCNLDDKTQNETGSNQNAGSEHNGPFKINKTDVSISVGETFQLKLMDSNGNVVSVAWSATIADICSIDGNSITGAEKGRTELSATYNGETFTCIVRVR